MLPSTIGICKSIIEKQESIDYTGVPRLDRQIGECTAAVHNTLVHTLYWNVATTFVCIYSYSPLAHHTP